MRYELTDNEWSAIKPMLPNKPRADAIGSGWSVRPCGGTHARP
jgi:transposase